MAGTESVLGKYNFKELQGIDLSKGGYTDVWECHREIHSSTVLMWVNDYNKNQTISILHGIVLSKRQYNLEMKVNMNEF